MEHDPDGFDGDDACLDDCWFAEVVARVFYPVQGSGVV